MEHSEHRTKKSFIQAKNKNGDTIVHIGLRSKHTSFTEELWDGLSPTQRQNLAQVKNINDDTIAHIALDNNDDKFYDKFCMNIFNSLDPSQLKRVIETVSKGGTTLLQQAEERSYCELFKKMLENCDIPKMAAYEGKFGLTLRETLEYLDVDDYTGDDEAYQASQELLRIFNKAEEEYEKKLTPTDREEARQKELNNTLIYWSNRGDTQGFNAALEAGARIASTTHRGDNCLHLAVKRGNYALVNLILQTKEGPALLSGQNQDGQTPLHYAARYPRAHPTVLKALLSLDERALAITTVDNDGKTPAELAAERFYTRVAKQINDAASLVAAPPAKSHNSSAPQPNSGAGMIASTAAQELQPKRSAASEKSEQNMPTKPSRNPIKLLLNRFIKTPDTASGNQGAGKNVTTLKQSPAVSKDGDLQQSARSTRTDAEKSPQSLVEVTQVQDPPSRRQPIIPQQGIVPVNRNSVSTLTHSAASSPKNAGLSTVSPLQAAPVGTNDLSQQKFKQMMQGKPERQRLKVLNRTRNSQLTSLSRQSAAHVASKSFPSYGASVGLSDGKPIIKHNGPFFNEVRTKTGRVTRLEKVTKEEFGIKGSRVDYSQKFQALETPRRDALETVAKSTLAIMQDAFWRVMADELGGTFERDTGLRIEINGGSLQVFRGAHEINLNITDSSQPDFRDAVTFYQATHQLFNHVKGDLNKNDAWKDVVRAQAQMSSQDHGLGDLQRLNLINLTFNDVTLSQFCGLTTSLSVAQQNSIEAAATGLHKLQFTGNAFKKLTQVTAQALPAPPLSALTVSPDTGARGAMSTGSFTSRSLKKPGQVVSTLDKASSSSETHSKGNPTTTGPTSTAGLLNKQYASARNKKLTQARASDPLDSGKKKPAAEDSLDVRP